MERVLVSADKLNRLLAALDGLGKYAELVNEVRSSVRKEAILPPEEKIVAFIDEVEDLTDITLPDNQYAFPFRGKKPKN